MTEQLISPTPDECRYPRPIQVAGVKLVDCSAPAGELCPVQNCVLKRLRRANERTLRR